MIYGSLGRFTINQLLSGITFEISTHYYLNYMCRNFIKLLMYTKRVLNCIKTFVFKLYPK